jgi:hypothetical protein
MVARDVGNVAEFCSPQAGTSPPMNREHIRQPARLAWKSMCATGEGKEKGGGASAIWGNSLPALKKTWKSVDNVTSEAFVGMWRARVAEFYGKYVATAAAAANP